METCLGKETLNSNLLNSPKKTTLSRFLLAKEELNTHTHIYVIKSRWQHGFPRPSLFLSLSLRTYHPLLPAGLPNYILCHRRADVNKFLLIDPHWHFYVYGSKEERHLWVRPCFSSCVPYVLLYGATQVLWGTWKKTCFNMQSFIKSNTQKELK